MTKRSVLIALAIAAVFVAGGLAIWFYQHLRSRPAGGSPPVAIAPTQGVVRNEELEHQLFGLRWVAYAPTGYHPRVSPPVRPSDASLRADLEVLRKAGFDGLVTYGAELESIPLIAEQVGFRGLLLGVWQPDNPKELAKAKAAAKHEIVVGIIVGNEGLTFSRYALASLRSAMEEIKRETGKPVSTTEVIESYFTKPELIAWSDFLAVNAHPYHHNIRDAQRAVEWTVKSYENLLKRAAGKPLLFKEVGLPSAGAEGLSEETQAQYYTLLGQTRVRFVWFEAFDGPWKTWATAEPHWGLWRSNRRPKPVVRLITKELLPG